MFLRFEALESFAFVDGSYTKKCSTDNKVTKNAVGMRCHTYFEFSFLSLKFVYVI